MTKQATLYRMITDEHICPYGIKAKDLLQRQGYQVEDHHLTSREEADQFKAEYHVETTPQTFIGGDLIGGYDDLRAIFEGVGEQAENETSYQPIIAIFATTFLMAIAASWAITGGIAPVRTVELFIAFSMVVLAVQKLRDLEGFSMQFLVYDLLAQRWVRYSYLYPFAEAFAGILMIAGAFTFLSAPIALFIGTVGAISVIKAVYIDKRELKCACVGGNSNVPLGFVSLTENLMMIVISVWMLVK